MTKKEFFLYIKTFGYNFLVGLVFFVPFMIIVGLFFGTYDQSGLMSDEQINSLLMNNYYYISFYFVYLVVVSFPINTLTGNFFYKSLVKNNLNKEKVLKVYITISIIFSLIYLTLSQVNYVFWWPEIPMTIVGVLLSIKIFKNVVENNGQINYKTLWRI